MAPLYATAASRHLDILHTVFAYFKLDHEQIPRNARRAVLAAGPDIARASALHLLSRRSMTVNHTQSVTLGVIVAYVVVIALLWNLPYIRWSLWPFKVSANQGPSTTFEPGLLNHCDRCLS
jgi:uncharacterized membrane protein YccC